MITNDFVALLILAFVPLAIAIFVLALGIYSAITDKVWFFCIEMIFFFVLFSFLSGFIFHGAYEEYQNAIPQNQVKILKQKVSDAEKELQKYLIDHPELKEEK